MLYDGFGKEILSPIYHPERLEELLFCILETEVKIRQVIPSDGTRIAEESGAVSTKGCTDCQTSGSD